MTPETSPLPPWTTYLPSKLYLQADYFDGQVDLGAFAAAHPEFQVHSRNPLVVLVDGCPFFLTRFGVMVAWGASENQIRVFQTSLRRLPGVGPRVESAGDRLWVNLGADQDRADYNEVWLRDLTLAKLRIVSLALAQSVALENFETEVTAAMAQIQPLLAALRREGRIRLGHREVLKIVGFAMDIRASVLNNLTLFEDPPETWESESLDGLHRALRDQFDLPRRGEALTGKLAYLTDAGQTLMDLLSTRKAHQLEWIVIVLIFIETAIFVLKEMKFH